MWTRCALSGVYAIVCRKVISSGRGSGTAVPLLSDHLSVHARKSAAQKHIKGQIYFCCLQLKIAITATVPISGNHWCLATADLKKRNKPTNIQSARWYRSVKLTYVWQMHWGSASGQLIQNSPALFDIVQRLQCLYAESLACFPVVLSARNIRKAVNYQQAAHIIIYQMTYSRC